MRGILAGLSLTAAHANLLPLPYLFGFSPRYTGLSLPYLIGLLPHLLSHDTAGVPGGDAFFG